MRNDQWLLFYRRRRFPGLLPDQNDSSLTVRFDGADGATSAVDTSPYGHVLTFNGNAQLDTAQKFDGVSSLLLDGTGDYVSLPNTRAFDIGAGEDFTIRARVRFAALSGFATIFALWNATANRRSFALFAIDNGTTFIKVLRFSSSTDGSATVSSQNSANDAFVLGSWLDITIVRDVGIITGYLGRVAVLSGTRNEAFYQNTNDVIAIGASSEALTFVNGHIDRIQFIKGRAIAP